MKRLIFLICLVEFSALNAAEKKNYLNYEKLPANAQLFFNAHGTGFYIRPQDSRKLGSESAYNNFLLSNVIRNALEQGAGDPINSIHLPLSREEFLAFVNFAKLSAEIQSFEAFEEAFKDFDGVKILNTLQYDPKIIKEIQENRILNIKKAQEAIKKRKRDEEIAEVTKKFKGMPQVNIDRMSGRSHMTGLELTEAEVLPLTNIPNSIITDLIDVAEPGEKITITLPDNLSNVSVPVLQNFIDIVIKSYSEDLFKEFVKIYPLLRFYIIINDFTQIKDVKNYLETLHGLADFFGYIRLAKGIRLIIDDTFWLKDQVVFDSVRNIPSNALNVDLLNLLFKQKLIDKADFLNIPLLLAKLNEIDKLNQLTVGNEKLEKFLSLFDGFIELMEKAKKARLSGNNANYLELQKIIDKAVTKMAEDLPKPPSNAPTRKQQFLTNVLIPLFSNDPIGKSVLNNIYLD